MLREITALLKKELNPSRLFLFGSRAKGTHRPDSDYDFVVVTKKKVKERYSGSAHSLIQEKYGVSADVFVYSEKDFDEWKDQLSSIAETALNTGTEIDLG